MRTLRTRSKQLASMQFTDVITDGIESPMLSRLLGSAAILGTRLRMKKGLQLGVDDVIFIGKGCEICCIVKACYKADDRVGLIVEQLEFQEQVGDDCSKWQRSDWRSHFLIGDRMLRHARFWTHAGMVYTILHPLRCE